MEPVSSSIPTRLEHQAATTRASAQQQGKKGQLEATGHKAKASKPERLELPLKHKKKKQRSKQQ